MHINTSYLKRLVKVFKLKHFYHIYFFKAGKYLGNWIIENKDIVCGKYDFCVFPFYIICTSVS